MIGDAVACTNHKKNLFVPYNPSVLTASSQLPLHKGAFLLRTNFLLSSCPRVALEPRKTVENCTKISLPCVKGGGPRSGGRIVSVQMLLVVRKQNTSMHKNNLDFFDRLNGTAPSGAVPRFLFSRLGAQEKDARIAPIALVELGNRQEFAPPAAPDTVSPEIW